MEIKDIVDFLKNWKLKNGTIDSKNETKVLQLLDELGTEIDKLSVTPMTDARNLILYGGADGGVYLWQIAKGASQTGQGYYYISDTVAGQILNDDEVWEELLKICNGDKELINLIYGNPINGERCPYPFNGEHLALNDRISRNLASNAVGNVTVWAPNGVTNSVLSDTELRTILTNKSVTSINGISKDLFIKSYIEHAGISAFPYDSPELLDQSVLNKIYNEIKSTTPPGYFDELVVFYDRNGAVCGVDTTSLTKGTYIKPVETLFEVSLADTKTFISESDLINKYPFLAELSDEALRIAKSKFTAYEYLVASNADSNIVRQLGMLTYEDITLKYNLDPLDFETINKYVSFEYLTSIGADPDVIKTTGIMSDAEIKAKYKLSVDNSYVMDFYRKAEYRISMGEDPTKVFVGEMFDETKVQFTANNYLLFKDIKDLRLDDFLEFAKHEFGFTVSDDAVRAAHTTRTKLQLTKTLRSLGNIAATAYQLYMTVDFIVSMADGLADGTLSARDVGEETSAFISSSVGGWIASEATVALCSALLPVLGVNPILGAVAIVVFAIGAGIAGSKAGDWIARELYQPSYDTVWGLLDYFFSDNVKMHLLEGSNDSDIMDFSQGLIKHGLLKYDVEYGIDVDGLYGDDIIAGYIHDDNLHGNEGNDIIYGGEGDDSITGDEGNDTLYGNEGNDNIAGNAGVDVIGGGEGDDTLNGGTDDDVIKGGTGDDKIYGGEGGDYLYGEENDDYINGGDDTDYIDGGNGNDTLYGDQIGDVLGGDDTISGGTGFDIIYGGYGEDAIFGGEGNDIIYGDDEETITTYHGDADVISGDSGDDTIYGGAGDDYIWGDADNDTLFGYEDDDTLSGGSGKDILYGGTGDDTLYGDEKDSPLSGDNDFIYGEDGEDLIDGGAGSDRLFGGENDDELHGGTGADYIFGGSGWDDLNGGHGDDSLRGGDRADTYYFHKSNGSDNIYDQYGTNTVVFEGIELSDLLIAYAGAYQQDLVFTIASTGETLTIIDYMHTADSFKYKFDGESGYYTVEDNDGVLSFEKIESSHSGSGYDTHWDKLLDNTSNNNIDIYESATVAQPPRDPLVIDLGEDGIELTTIDDGVYFDLDKNGFAEKTAWIGTEDGFLVLDRNGNGIIDDGGELFSDQVVMSNGEISSSGFSALADLDDNTNESEDAIGDGIIDEKDAEFKNLRVWIDANHNGITDEGELKSLDELEIASISLNHVQTDTVDSDTGTIITETSEVVFKNGTVREISEHWFQINSADTEEINVTNIDDDLTSFGNMHSLSYALENDTSGELQELVDSFMNSDDYVDKRVIARKILYYITNSSDIAVNSRGGAIDARNLHVLETIMGVDSFVGVNGSTTPNSNAASILNQLFSDFDRTYFILLNEVLGEANYLELIEELPDDNGEIILDLSAVEDIVDHYISLGMNVDEMLFDIGVYLKSYDSTYGTNYLNSFKSHYPDRADEISIMVNGNFVVGTEENDTLNGSSSQDVIWAESGNDNISTGAGNDIIYSGTGNDTINAGAGADIVYGEDGNDIINADSGNDTIYAGTGDDTIKAGADNDLVYGEDGNDTIDGGTGNDTLYGGTGDDTVNAGEGDDVVYGEDGNDTIEGGAGNDTIDAGTGNDVISGSEGDDTLAGGESDDTYHFGAAHGNDIVFDADGANMLEFGDELSADDYDLSVDINGGFVLTHKETGETISLPDFVTNPLAYDFTFAGEGKVLGGGEEREVVEGTDEDNTLNAGDGFNIIYGNGGNDTIEGGENLDFVFGGDGNDTISGGNGTNILHGEAGNDTLSDGEGSSYLNGGDGDDTLFAGAGNDVLLGGTGADEMHGEDGDDVLAGNEGDDTLYGEAGADTLYADAGNDTLYGGDDDDALFGGDGDDTLHGEAGNDYLESGNGNNTMYGGDGDDTFVTGEDTDYVYGGTGNDYVIGGNGDNYMYGEDGDDRLQGGEGYDYMEGGLGNDNLSGGNGFNEMYGQEGDDYIYGGDHADYIDGGVGNDHLYGANATDGQNEIYGREGNDTIYDGDQGAYIEGNEGDDTIRAGGGNDVIDGGVGNDYIQDDHGDDTVIFKAGYGTDTISDAAGNNTLVLSGLSIEDATAYKEGSDLKLAFSTGDNLIIKQYFDGGAFQNFSIDGVLLGDLISGYHGTENDDWMSASNGNDTTLYGDGGNDNISGNNGSDTLYGGSGNDTLNGGENADTLDGGEGTDSLYGGNGDDTYVFGKGYGSDTIEDWNGSSIVKLTDINIDEVSISNSNDSALVLTVDSTGDTLTINGYKWNQGGYTFEFADGTTDTVNKDTWNWESGFGTSSDDTTGDSTGEGETTQPDVDVTDGYVLNGSSNSEWLGAPNDNGGVIDAGDGDDGLNGGSGSDKLYGGAGTDNLYGNDGDDILDGGTGTDGLNGGNGTDTYIFAKGYGNDTVNEWGSDITMIKLTDINSDEVTLNSQSENNLVISVNGTSDTLTISNYRWSQGSFTLEFADGAVAAVNKETWEMEYSQYPTVATEETAAVVSEDEIAQTNAELLSELYAEDALSTEFISETDSTIISDVTESTTVADETDEVADQTDLQVMILTENMSAFADEDNVSDGINVADASADVTAMNQLLVNSAV